MEVVSYDKCNQHRQALHRREAYLALLQDRPGIELTGASGDTAADSLLAAALGSKPQVMLLGFKTLDATTVDRLHTIREKCPNIAMVVLSARYDVKGIKALREFSRATSAGCAYLLKHTIDTVEQFAQMIYSAADGRIILDPVVMDGMIASQDPNAAFLKELTPREMETLSWMSKGYRNNTIADVLCLELKTVERHINNIYGKLGDRMGSRHARVHAVMLYLKATGLLPDGFSTDDQN